jgi:TIR domain
VAFRVFINYRREDAGGHAGRLFDSLRARYPGDRLFMDIDTIEPGLDFTEVIDEAIESCEAVIALIGKRWVSVMDASGNRRLDNPADYVRLELEAALRRGVRVIPVLVAGGEVPRSEDLPASLEKLTRLNALEMTDARWQFDLSRLLRVLERLEQKELERERAAAGAEGLPGAPAAASAAPATEAPPASLPSPPVAAPPGPPYPPSRGTPPGRRRALLLAGGAGLVLAGLVAFFLTRDGAPEVTPSQPGSGTATSPGETPTESEPPTSPPASVSPTGVPPEPDALAWARVQSDLQVFGGPGQQVINRVTVFGTSLVAVGYEDQGEGADGAVWTSDDGESWRQPTVPSMSGDGEQVVGGIAERDGMLVAVGSDGEGDARDAAAWTSTDGVEWAPADDPDAALAVAGDQAMRRVAAAGPGFVAVGYDVGDAAVWTFIAGVWRQEQHPSFGGAGDQQMWSVTGLGSDQVVAVGATQSEDGDLDAGAWFFDGTDWRAATGPFGGAGDQQMTMVIATETGLVGAGFDGPRGEYDAAVWTSTDGLEWSRVDAGPEVFGGNGDQEIVGLAAWEAGLVAVGFDRSVDGANPAAWTSSDGSEWTRVPPDQLNEVGDQRMKTVAVLGSRLVALGRESVEDDVDAAAWVADAEG